MSHYDFHRTLFTSYQDALDYYHRYLNDDVETCNTHAGPLLDETMILKDALLKMNRAGFLTTSSQPGERIERILYSKTPKYGARIVLKEVDEQREYVEGYLPSKSLLLLNDRLEGGRDGFMIQFQSALLTKNRMKQFISRSATHYELNGEVVSQSRREEIDVPCLGDVNPLVSIFQPNLPFLSDLYHVTIVDRVWNRTGVLCDEIATILSEGAK